MTSISDDETKTNTPSLNETLGSQEEIHEKIKLKEAVTKEIKTLGEAQSVLKEEAKEVSHNDLLQRISNSIDNRGEEPWSVRNKCPTMVHIGEDTSKLYPVCSLFTENPAEVPKEDWHLLTMPFQIEKEVEHHKTLCCSKTMQILSNAASQCVMNKEKKVIVRMLMRPKSKEEATKEFWRNLFAQFLQLGTLSYKDVRQYATRTEDQKTELPFASLDTSLSKLSLEQQLGTPTDENGQNGTNLEQKETRDDI